MVLSRSESALGNSTNIMDFWITIPKNINAEKSMQLISLKYAETHSHYSKNCNTQGQTINFNLKILVIY